MLSQSLSGGGGARAEAASVCGETPPRGGAPRGPGYAVLGRAQSYHHTASGTNPIYIYIYTYKDMLVLIFLT